MLVLLPILFNDVNAQATSGYCHVKVVDKHGDPIQYPEVMVQRPGEPYWIYYRGGADGTVSIWLRSDQLGQSIKISVTDIFRLPLQIDKDEIICENFGETETVRILNSHVITIKVHDSYYGYEGASPPITAVVNSYTTMYRTISSNGEITALLSDDFEGPLMIGAPLRKTESIIVTKDEDEYSVLLEPTLKLSATLEDHNLVIKIQWDSVELRDIGDKKLIPYSLEVLALSSDGKIKPLSKYGPDYIKSPSGEDFLEIPFSPEEEIPPEQASGALIARVYIDYEIQSSNYWSELREFGDTSWIRFLVRYTGRYIVDKVPLVELAFNPFADPSISEKLGELAKELESKETELKNANEKISGLSSEIQKMQAEIEASEKKLIEYEGKISEYESKLSDLEDALRREKEKSADLQSQLDEEINKRKQAEATVTNLIAENANLKADLEMTRLLLIVVIAVSAVCIALLIMLQRRRAQKTEQT